MIKSKDHKKIFTHHQFFIKKVADIWEQIVIEQL